MTTIVAPPQDLSPRLPEVGGAFTFEEEVSVHQPPHVYIRLGDENVPSGLTRPGFVYFDLTANKIGVFEKHLLLKEDSGLVFLKLDSPPRFSRI